MTTETPSLRWFEETDRKCSCGKRATGILRGERNESYGPHCRRCADRRLRASERVRKENAKMKSFIVERASVEGSASDV